LLKFDVGGRGRKVVKVKTLEKGTRLADESDLRGYRKEIKIVSNYIGQIKKWECK